MSVKAAVSVICTSQFGICEYTIEHNAAQVTTIGDTRFHALAIVQKKL
jgi:hypothetical protein